MLYGLSLLDEERHFTALESLSLQSLADGDLVKAFKFADRRCRIPPIADVHHYTLRAEISFRMGYINAAIADLARALELAPDDIPANRRMLAWETGQAQINAARRLLTAEHDFAAIGPAIAVLREAGETAFGAVTWTDSAVSGWAVWNRLKRARVTITSDGDSKSKWLIPDPQHPLATETASAADFSLERPRSRVSQHVALSTGRTMFYQHRLLPNVQDRRRDRAQPGAETPARREPISVVIPVYGDFEATKACFDSLFRAIASEPETRIIIVDDATPDARIKRLLQSIAEEPNVLLLTNEQNLGFAESANRGLGETGRGDVIFLNADTVVPPGFMARLAATAHSSPDIGTLTPLSNNGEFTSLPVPYRANPIGTYDEIRQIDAIAAHANADRTIDLPNGIGFCLYVTRACLDAAGYMSVAFHRGYLEDVELCLRARELGFRSVCASSVYVGHAGSRSFGAEKRALVVKNVETIEQLFPKYRYECASFLKADPLHPAREAIERFMPAGRKKTTLLVAASGLTRAVAEERASNILAKDARALIVEICSTARGPGIGITDPAKDIPQSILFQLTAAAERAAALDYLRNVNPGSIEIISAAKTPCGILDAVLALDCPIDLVIADGSLLCPHRGFVRPDGSICGAPRMGRLCDDCSFRMPADETEHAQALDERNSTLKKLFARARDIYAPGQYAKSFTSRFLGRRKISELRPTKRPLPEPPASGGALSEQSIGFVAVGHGTAEYRLMKHVALAINRELPERPIVVIGETIDDIGLMKLDNVHVTGAVEPAEYDRIILQYAIGTLFVPIRQPLFGHPKINDFARRMPTAFFDWSFGEISPRPADLALPPDLADEELLTALLPWLAQN